MSERFLVLLQDPEALRKKVQAAVWKGDANTLRRILSWAARAGRPCTESLDDCNDTPLCVASQQGYARCVEVLLEFDASLEARSTCGETPLMRAAERGHVGVVEQLLMAGARVDAADKERYTPLAAAAEEGHVEVVQRLVQEGAEVNASTISGATALLLAASQGHEGVVRVLLDSGADCNRACCFDGKTALAAVLWAEKAGLAPRAKTMGVTEMLLGAGAWVGPAVKYLVRGGFTYLELDKMRTSLCEKKAVLGKGLQPQDGIVEQNGMVQVRSTEDSPPRMPDKAGAGGSGDFQDPVGGPSPYRNPLENSLRWSGDMSGCVDEALGLPPSSSLSASQVVGEDELPWGGVPHPYMVQ